MGRLNHRIFANVSRPDHGANSHLLLGATTARRTRFNPANSGIILAVNYPQSIQHNRLKNELNETRSLSSLNSSNSV